MNTNRTLTLVDVLTSDAARHLEWAYKSTFNPAYFLETLELEACGEISCLLKEVALKGTEARLRHLAEVHGVTDRLSRVQVAWVLGVNWRRLKRKDFLEPVEVEPNAAWSVEQLIEFIQVSPWVKKLSEEEEQRWLRLEPISAIRIHKWNREKQAVGIAPIEELQKYSDETRFEYFREKAEAVISTVFDPNLPIPRDLDESQIIALSQEQILKLDLIESTPFDSLVAGVDWDGNWGDFKGESWADFQSFLKRRHSPPPQYLVDVGTVFPPHVEEINDFNNWDELTEPDDQVYYVYSNGYMGALTGSANIGKSSFLPRHFREYYTKPLESPTWIVADPDCSNGDLLTLILEEIGTPDQDSYPYKPEPIADSVAGRRRQIWKQIERFNKRKSRFEFILCCDNAEYLRTTALQELRSLHTKCKATVLLVGSNELWENIKRGGMEDYFFHIELDSPYWGSV